MRQITVRLKPNQDLKEKIERFVDEKGIKAGVIVSLVGSLKQAALRYAGQKEVDTISGPLEIVSATGTVSKNGCHIHITTADENGATVGGHLSPGCLVRTTVEIVILVFDDIEYKRQLDKETGFEELSIK